MELELNGVKLKVYESGEIHRLYKKGWLLRKGSINSKGYIKFKINSKSFSIHRIVYKAFNPDWDMDDPKQQIDHINRVRDDNRICNLRIVSNAENQQNQKMKGYHYCNSYNCWRSQLTINGKQYVKHCDTEEEAIQTTHELRLKHFPFYERTAIPEGE